MTLEEAIEKIKKIADNSMRFKIGKTGQDLRDRFDTEYKDDYDAIHDIAWSDKKKVIDSWEKYLIEYFLNDQEYQDKCDNDQVGGGDMGQSKEYRIYVVVKR